MRRPAGHATRSISIEIRECAMELTSKIENTLYGSSHLESLNCLLSGVDDNDLLIGSIIWSSINFHSTLSLISHTLLFILTTQLPIVSNTLISFPRHEHWNPPSPTCIWYPDVSIPGLVWMTSSIHTGYSPPPKKIEYCRCAGAG